MINRSLVNGLLFGFSLVSVFIIGCGDEKSSDDITGPNGTPELTWTSTGGSYQIVVKHHYSGGFPAGYTAYARLENTGESGSAALTVTVLEGSTVKRSKDVSFTLNAGEEYTIVINGGGGATPKINEYSYVHVRTWKIRVESNNASESWEAYLITSGEYNSFNPFTIGTVELQEGLVTP